MINQDLRRARDLLTPAVQLTQLALHTELDVRAAVVAHPNTPLFSIEGVLNTVDRFTDPTAPAVLAAGLLANPRLVARLQGADAWAARLPLKIIRAMTRSPALRLTSWQALWRLPSMRVKLALLTSPTAPPGAGDGLVVDGLLTLSRLQLDDDDIAVLATVTMLPGVTSLDLSNNLVTDAGVRTLADAATFAKLTALDLSGNQISPAGARALAKATAFPRLRTLSLAHNPIGDDGVKALARATGLPKLTTLDLGDNEIARKGARA